MQWKLTHRHNHECIENKGGKTLSYDPNLGIQIIEYQMFWKQRNGLLKIWIITEGSILMRTGVCHLHSEFRISPAGLFYGRRGTACIIAREGSSCPENSVTG